MTTARNEWRVALVPSTPAAVRLVAVLELIGRSDREPLACGR